MATSWVSVASAIPPGGAVDNPKGAAVTIAPSTIAPGGKVVFAGTGFSSGEEVSVKIDDGQVLSTNGSPPDVFMVATGNADGTISGTVDLAKVQSSTPVAAGVHSLRFLSSTPIRSVHGDFTVAAPVDPVSGTGPNNPAAPGAPADPGTGAAPSTGGSPSTSPGPAGPVAQTPALATTRIGKSSLKVRGTRSSIKVTGAAAVVYGTVRVRSVSKLKVGSSKAKQRLLFSPAKYAVAPDQAATLSLKVSADGRALLKRSRSIKAIVEVTETTGAVAKRKVTVRR